MKNETEKDSHIERDKKERSIAKAKVYTNRFKRKKRLQEFKNTNSVINSKDPNKVNKPNILSKVKNNVKETVKDMKNPNSQFKGVGRVFQLTGTSKYVKKFVDSNNSEKDDILTPLKKDLLIVNGLRKEVKLLEDYNKGYKVSDLEYQLSMDKIKEFLNKELNFNKIKKDKNYSSWEIFNKLCEENN